MYTDTIYSPNEIFIVGVDYQNTEGGLVAFRPRPPVRTLARFLVFHADTVAFANRRARGHVFHACTVTVISTRLETLVTHALVRSHALPVFAPVLARWRTAEFFRPNETFPTLANIRRYAGAVVTRHADGFAPIIRVLLEPVVASANIGLRARAVRAILIANRFTARDDRVHDHLHSNESICLIALYRNRYLKKEKRKRIVALTSFSFAVISIIRYPWMQLQVLGAAQWPRGSQGSSQTGSHTWLIVSSPVAL